MKHMTLRPVESIPARGDRKRRRTDAPETQYEQDGEHFRRVRNGGYRQLLRLFLTGEYGPYAAVSTRWHPDTVYRSLQSARRHLGVTAQVDILQRGDRVYLTQPHETVADREARRESLAATLLDFDASTERTRTVDGIDTPAWHALHYQRTRLGLGHVSIRREGEAVTLVNTMVD